MPTQVHNTQPIWEMSTICPEHGQEQLLAPAQRLDLRSDYTSDADFREFWDEVDACETCPRAQNVFQLSWLSPDPRIQTVAMKLLQEFDKFHPVCGPPIDLVSVC